MYTLLTACSYIITIRICTQNMVTVYMSNMFRWFNGTRMHFSKYITIHLNIIFVYYNILYSLLLG